MSSVGRFPRVLILHIIDSKDQFGGVEKVILDLTKGLRERHREVALAVNEGLLLEEARKASVETIPLKTGKKWNLPQSVIAILSACAKFRPAIVHSHHRYTTFCAQMVLGRAYRLLHTHHVLMFDKKWNPFYGDHTTAVCQSVKDHFVKFYRLSSDKITVIHNGVRVPQLDKNERDRSLGQEDSRKMRAIVIGRLEEQKGHVYLLEALSRLLPAVRDRLHVTLIGEGSKRPLLEKMIRKWGLSEVELIGFRLNLHSYYAQADFSILPSLWEGFSLGILESYMYGVPLIATDVAGAREIIRDGETGLLVAPKDIDALKSAIEKLVSKPELIQRFGEAGRADVAKAFTVDHMVSAYVGLYQQLMRQ